MLTEENRTNQLTRIKLLGLYGGHLLGARTVIATNGLATNQSAGFK